MINNLYTLNLLNCKECLLCGNGYVAHDYIINNKDYKTIMLIGQNPGATEIEKGLPFVGWSGQFLREKIFNNFKDYNFYITNTFKCFTINNKNPLEILTKSQSQICKSLYLDKEIEEINPEYIFIFGKVAEKCISNYKKIDRPSFVLNKRIYFSLYHPSYVRQYNKIKEFDSQIETIKYIIKVLKRTKKLKGEI